MVSSTVLITGVLCLLLGVAIGVMFSRKLTPPDEKTRDLEQHLQESQQRLNAYQGEVEEHFKQTAEMVNSLTENYRAVHEHLAEGASELCAVGAGSPAITRLTDDSSQHSDEDDHQVAPPLDYAPKATPHEKGMLTEDFGLDKSIIEKDDEDDKASAA